MSLPLFQIDEIWQQHSPIGDKHTYRGIHIHTSSKVALLKRYLLRSYLFWAKTEVYPLSPSLHFTPGCLRMTGLRNKPSMENGMLTSSIFTRRG